MRNILSKKRLLLHIGNYLNNLYKVLKEELNPKFLILHLFIYDPDP